MSTRLNLILFLITLFMSAKVAAQVQLNIIDVEYGQAIHLEVDHRNYLIDTGDRTQLSTVMQFLAQKNVTRLEGIFLTHTHKDHAGSLLPIIQQIHTEAVYWNEMPSDKQWLRDEFEKAKKVTKLKYMGHGKAIILGQDTMMRSLNSNFEEAGLNDNSLVFILVHKKQKVLMGADAGIARQNNLVEMEKNIFSDIQIFVWPHHGDQLSKPFLDSFNKVNYCVLSVGKNPYGLPHPDFEDQADQLCHRLIRTDQRGHIEFKIDKKVYLKREKK